jgi:signal transduction histidine kinase
VVTPAHTPKLLRRETAAAQKWRNHTVAAGHEDALAIGRAMLTAVRAHTLIDRILDQVHAAHATLDFRPHDARRLLLEAAALGPLAAQRSLTLEVFVPSDEIFVVCDYQRMLPGLICVFTNAMRFAPAGSTVSLALDRVEDGAAFSIAVESSCVAAFELVLLEVRGLLVSHAARAWVSSGTFGTTLSLFLRATSPESSDPRPASLP